MDLNFSELFDNIYRVGASVGTPVVCAVIAALIYAVKGKSWGGGAALGFFLGPIGVFIALANSGNNASKHKGQVYTPESTDFVPQMRTVQVPVSQPSPASLQYRLPGRCPNCNAPLRQQELHSPYTTCAHCGSQVEAMAA
ncbi:MAG: hypothetical protein JW934_07125 [Anaerolineae bacterium]|nr:hypothetical protein [Anaerolineae bacterium]